MLDVFTVTLPIYLIIALGYVTVKTRFIGAGIVEYLVQFVVKIAIPVMVFMSITQAGQGNILIPELMISYGIMLIVFLVGGRMVLRLLGSTPGQSWALSLGISNPNTIMIGFPLALVLYPDYAAPIFASFLLVENLTSIPFSQLLAEMAGRNSRGFKAVLADILQSVKGNMILMAVILALISRALGIAPSGPIEETIRIIGQTATGLALFYIGAVCTRSHLTGPVGIISAIAFLKLIAMPLFAAVLFPLFLDDPELISAVIMFASIPMLTIFPMLTRQSGAEELAASVLIITTALSFVTVSITLMLI